MEKRLCRSEADKVLFGVCGGLGEYFDVDPILFRLGFVLAVLLGGSGVLAYIVLAIVMPAAERKGGPQQPAVEEGPLAGEDGAPPTLEVYAGHTQATPVDRERRARQRRAAGALLVVCGVLLLGANLNWFAWLRAEYFWPLALIALGAYLLVGQGRR